MDTPLAGTAALVTGASSGIGAATASGLAAQGASVALVARRKDRLDDLVETIRAAGGDAIAVAADITDRRQAASAVDQAVQAFGRLDTLVNNAGVMLLGPIEDAPVEEWDRMLAINVQGLLYTTHAALPHLLAAVETGDRRTADIVNVSSEAGRTSRVGMGVYNLTKHGVGGFSESLRQEVAGRHVRVSLVEPGPVATELFGHIRPEVLKGAEGTFGTTNLLTAEDVAETISFVVTRRAGAVVNEVLLRPDAAL
ncbi:NADP-dependent 3-hydroxy acid dehydrogenase YdfG [Actinomycetospora succinea]|uniref:NADP-dependent 3-hydroxy acid dehydrogenase YdfG n=1 Tax=Actinomycetospora succinea TaxID=663603 RepID=A0A4R6VHT2_9PSEU|nr:SDR family NAD(P)-dependent oxidoreductase [Actinomycetospora succinea]TDQ60957.1 NADP-dependent 3-hydroxy acid dehydrogenase YdfG [Actinomycetospora succinea]